MNFFTRLRSNIRERIMPLQTFNVEVLVWYKLEDRPIGVFHVTATARTKRGARKRAMDELTLRPDRVKSVKKPLNEKTYGRDY